MAKISLRLDKKSLAQILTLAKNVHTGLTGNAFVTTAVPPLATLQTHTTAAEAAFDAYEAAKENLKSLRLTRDAAFATLENDLRTEAATVMTATGGNETQIASTNFEVAQTPTSTTEPPDQVLNLRVTAPDNEGYLKATWKRVATAQRYEIAASPDPVGPGTWVIKSSSNKTKALVNTFTSGQKIWMKVRAVNAIGDGAWSDVASKIVP